MESTGPERLEHFMAKGDSVCRHWIPKSHGCYACIREKQQMNSQFEHISCKKGERNDILPQLFEPSDYHLVAHQVKNKRSQYDNSNRSFQQSWAPNKPVENLTAPPGYQYPDSLGPPQYPQPVDTNPFPHGPPDPRRFMQNSRDQPLRSQGGDDNTGVFMKRSLAMAEVLPPSGYQGYWGQVTNPVVRQNQPVPDPYQAPMSGISSRRPERKVNKAGQNEDLFLRRSVIQPDMRYGNRFYEMKPEESRTGSHRSDINTRTNTWQQDSVPLYQDKNRAFDADGGFGGQVNYQPPPNGW